MTNNDNRTYFQIEVECTNSKSQDMFEVGRFETFEEAFEAMPEAISGLQRELDLRIHSPKKECQIMLNKVVEDEDGEWISSEGIDGCTVVKYKKTVWDEEKNGWIVTDVDNEEDEE